ncbi:MAG TPA: hydantoinase/oxoprolinase family protein [Acidimicrobiia bacterium]|nr:hydantoinase/oxoprolinase family protein [Acidimicrobiia bacterium]
MRVGVDTGGTFTDVVRDDGSIVKVASTPEDPSLAVARGIAGADLDVLAHGTTVATNALLERRGAAVALIANEGFADIIEIARQVRPSLYDPFADRPEPLVPRSLRFGVHGRLDATGKELEPFDGVVPVVPASVHAIAVCLLHADLNPAHERAVADAVQRARTARVVCSHEVSPEFREYERMITTVVEAYLEPVCAPYLERIDALARSALVMTSAGGLMPARDAARATASLLLSGPAGGVHAAAAIATACGFPDAVSFDMGGTSTDVCLIRGGVPDAAAQRTIAGFPVRLPALDVHTIGAGGGSIASVDAGGALHVGPRSAGAQPGPACYGRGGVEPTVTDADLVLGRISVDATFPELGRLDRVAAERALAGAGIEAEGVVRVVDAAMVRAVRVVTVERGVDPRDLALVAFGGAGPLHACAVADALGMRAVIVPPRAGVCSAVGLLCAPRSRTVVRSFTGGSLHEARARVEEDARALVGPDASVESEVDCRYEGQSHELTVATPDAFPDEHRRRNGHSRPGAPIEIVAVRARASSPAPLAIGDLPDVDRSSARGPVVVAEPDCTIWIPEGWRAQPGVLGALVLERT